jgi:hypothetical protein
MNQLKKYYIGLGVLSLVVVIVVAFGIMFALGVKSDAKLKGNITQLKTSLESYNFAHTTLPVNLRAANIANPSDIEYSVRDKNNYQLCATFHSSAPAPSYVNDRYDIQSQPNLPSTIVGSDYQSEWPYYHKKGRECVIYFASLKQVTIYDSTYTLCAEAGYKYYPVSYGLVSSVDPTGLSFSVSYSAITPGTKAAAAQSTPTTKSFTTDKLTKIFNSSCHVAKFTDIQVGSRINIYQNDSKSTLANGIYITALGVVQPLRPL